MERPRVATQLPEHIDAAPTRHRFRPDVVGVVVQ